MANHYRDKKEERAPAPRRDGPDSRAALHARAEAEAREKREWIAERKRQEKAAAEAEAREKREWIAERKRQEKAEEEARRQEKLRLEEEKQEREREAKAEQRREKARKRAERAEKLGKAVKIAVLLILGIAVLGGGAALFGAYRISQSQTNFPNVYLNGIPVGGLTREETEKTLTEQGWNDPEKLALRVELPLGVSFELDRGEAGLTMDKQEAVDAAFNYGHDQSLMGCVGTYLNARHNRVDLFTRSMEPDHEYVRARAEAAVQAFREKTSGESYSIDTEEKVMRFYKGAGELDLDLEKLIAAAEQALLGDEPLLIYDQMEGNITEPDFQALYDELNVEPVNARFEGKDFEIIPEIVGATFDIDEARRLWEAAGPMEELLIPIEIVEPEITAEMLQGELFKDLLGSQTTSFGGSTDARINNIDLAAVALDGVIIMPGETFSYNDTVGERTTERGFQSAAAYVSGKVEQQIGGGVCQVSSTLYCAALYSRMTIVSRTCHQFRVSYLPPGEDATVSWKTPDFKFRNDRDYPVKILTFCNPETMELTIEIWGTDTDGITVELHYETYTFHDEEYPDVILGSNAYLWIYYYSADGELLEIKEGSASTYHLHDYEINWPPEKKDKDKDKDNGGSDGEVIIDDGGQTPGGGGESGGGGDEGGGGGESGGGDDGGGGGDDGGGE